MSPLFHDPRCRSLRTAALASRIARPSLPVSARTLFATSAHCLCLFGVSASRVCLLASPGDQGMLVFVPMPAPMMPVLPVPAVAPMPPFISPARMVTMPLAVAIPKLKAGTETRASEFKFLRGGRRDGDQYKCQDQVSHHFTVTRPSEQRAMALFPPCTNAR